MLIRVLSEWSCWSQYVHIVHVFAFIESPDPVFSAQVGKIHLRSLITILYGGLYILANNLMCFFVCVIVLMGDGDSNAWHLAKGWKTYAVQVKKYLYIKLTSSIYNWPKMVRVCGVMSMDDMTRNESAVMHTYLLSILPGTTSNIPLVFVTYSTLVKSSIVNRKTKTVTMAVATARTHTH